MIHSENRKAAFQDRAPTRRQASAADLKFLQQLL
jgi:hypothetical protein